MSYRELLPHPALRPFVDRFWVRTPDAAIAGTVAGMAPVRILPDGCIDVLLDVPSGAARVVGTMTRSVLYDASAATLAAVRFKPGGAFPFLRVPAFELTDRVLGASELGARWLGTRSAGPRPPEGVVVELERALLDRLGEVALDRGVRHATRRLLSASSPGIDELARELRHSRQHLGRLFRQHVGVSPKEFARVARLQRAIAHVQRTPALGLAGAALDLGYYDQAHMTREFKHLAGVTPGAAREACGSIFPIRSLWLEA